MKNCKKNTKWMVGLAMMSTITILLANTPLGMIQLPFIKATTTHIPVILGAAIFGPAAGAILGGVFGICSMVSNTVTPTLMSFAFSPFLSTTGIIGAIKALWISVGCRILVGASSGLLWKGIKSVGFSNRIALPVVGFLGSMSNTVLVMSSIYFLLAEQYAEANNVAFSAVYGLIMATVTGAGIMEAIVALILVTVIGKVLMTALSRQYCKTTVNVLSKNN